MWQFTSPPIPYMGAILAPHKLRAVHDANLLSNLHEGPPYLHCILPRGRIIVIVSP